MLLYYITDRKSLAGTDAQQRNRLLARIGEAARAGVDYIQLREKDLAARDLERLTRYGLPGRIPRRRSCWSTGAPTLRSRPGPTACIFPPASWMPQKFARCGCEQAIASR